MPNSATPLSSSTEIPLDHPALNTPQYEEDFCPVEWGRKGWEVAPQHSHLKQTTKQAIVELWEQGREYAAAALAYCGRHGSVHKHCKKRNIARAHRHTCHVWICDYCGQPHNLLHCWLRKRSLEVRFEPQAGLELIGPLNCDLEAIALKLAKYFLRKGIDSARRAVVDPRGTSTRIRFVLKTGHISYRESLEYVRKTAGIGYSIQLHSNPNPLAVLKWMFASTEAVLKYCGHTRAQAFAMWSGKKRLLKTAGDFYAERDISLDIAEREFPEVQEREEVAPLDRCPCGQCDGVMETIPPKKRIAQKVEDIEAAYKHVDWSSCHDPFAVRRVSHKEPHMANFDASDVPNTESHAPPT